MFSLKLNILLPMSVSSNPCHSYISEHLPCVGEGAADLAHVRVEPSLLSFPAVGHDLSEPPFPHL